MADEVGEPIEDLSVEPTDNVNDQLEIISEPEDEYEITEIDEQETELDYEQEPGLGDEQELGLGDEQEPGLREEQEVGLGDEQKPQEPEPDVGHEQDAGLGDKQEPVLEDTTTKDLDFSDQLEMRDSALDMPNRIEDKELGDDVEKEDKEVKDEIAEEFVEGITIDEPPAGELKGSIHYDIGARVPEEPRASRDISGDFKRMSGDIRILRTLFDYQEEEEEKLFQKSPDIKVVIPSGISDVRKFCLERIGKLEDEKIAVKLRNSLLQRILVRYFKRKNMLFCLRELEHVADNFKRYTIKLDELESFLESSKHQQQTVELELLQIENIRAKKTVELEKLFSDFQTKESQVGQGLIYSKTGATISDKVIEKYIYRQKNGLLALRELRLEYLDVKSRVGVKEDEIYNLDRVDSKYTLMYFGKLTSENTAHFDKIEEKDSELALLRRLSQNTIEVLSHVREKLAALSNDILDLKNEIDLMEFHINSVRYDVNKIKQERDMFRFASVELKKESGLLHHPDLLRDMEASKDQYTILKNELENIQNDCKTKVRQLRNARKTLEGFIEIKGERKRIHLSKLNKHQSFKKGSNIKTIKPKKDVNQLTELKPTVITIKKK